MKSRAAQFRVGNVLATEALMAPVVGFPDVTLRLLGSVAARRRCRVLLDVVTGRETLGQLPADIALVHLAVVPAIAVPVRPVARALGALSTATRGASATVPHPLQRDVLPPRRGGGAVGLCGGWGETRAPLAGVALAPPPPYLKQPRPPACLANRDDRLAV